jgi:acetaldehyde dehydrogenase (acetylating)
MSALRVGIVGTGNIGTDLMMKVERSPLLELAGMAGIDAGSDGLRAARARGHAVTDQGLADLLARAGPIDLVFDATSAAAHAAHAQVLAARGIRSVDLTPASLGVAIVPPVNLAGHGDATEVSLVTCGAQATVPIVAAIAGVVTVTYAETISTIASRSAGPGTRQNIDEFTTATARAVESIGGAGLAKAIIILNPADPPVVMRNTVYARYSDGNGDTIVAAIAAAVAQVAAYVPGYRLATDPIFSPGMVTVIVEVEGAGDHLPAFSGNLDIMTAAAVRVAELYAEAAA